MTAPSRVHSSTDWDPMKEDYNDSTYDAQYQDSDASGRGAQLMQLDHRKLYITNIPPGLNEQGLKTAFEKYGVIEQAFLSRDPQKKYGLVRYETAAEARIAMMKLNRTEPLNLHVSLAHAKNEGQNGSSFRDRPQKEPRDSASSVSSNRERKLRNRPEEPVNDEEEQPDNSMGINHNFHLELEKIKLDQLLIQEEQLKCRQKMMMLQLQKKPNMIQTAPTVSSSRRLLPNGRVIVQERVHESDATFTAGGGDSRVTNRACVVCGTRADLYCARCTVTAYCSEICQRKDWGARHSAVCHNLLRLQSGSNPSGVSPAETGDTSCVRVPSPPPPLRQPHSPNANRTKPQSLDNSTTQSIYDVKNKEGFGDNQQGRAPANQSHKDKMGGENQRGRAPSTQFNNNKARFIPSGHNASSQRAQRPAPRPNVNQSQDAGGDGEEWGEVIDKKTHQPSQAPKVMDKTNDIAVSKTEIAKADVASTPKVQVASGHQAQKENKPSLRIAAQFSEVKNTQEVALVPAQYLIEKLPIGESFLLSVEHPTSACASKQPGFVCLAMHADFQDQYNALLGDIFDGDKTIVPTPGATFAYLDPTDEGWYRARCLNGTQSALLDGSRVATTKEGQCRALHTQFENIPEFCCVLCNVNAKVNMSFKCTILLKTAEGFKVSVESTDVSDSYLGEGTVTRWMPEVEVPPVTPIPEEATKPRPQATAEVKPQSIIAKTPQQTAKPQPAQMVQKPSLPDIPRPDIVNNGKYLLLHVTSLSRACVRSTDEEATVEFESVLQDTALYGIQSGKRLTEPPVAGQVVLCQYEEVHYRALVTRTKAADNRYKVQYAEYGNEEIVPLEKLYQCPTQLNLTSRPARASIVALSASSPQVTTHATEYIDSLKEVAELIATIPSGEKTAPSGSLVQLSLAKNKENINRKLEEMCTPDWKKLENAGGDVVESDVILFTNIKTLPLPTSRPFVLEVTDFGYLKRGLLSGFEQGASLPATVYGPLTDKINEYCQSSLCSKPYLPMVEELCLARLEPYPQWFRAVVVSHTPGDKNATVLFIDYGNIEDTVPVENLRKCMREFARDPAVAASVDIKDWPQQITDEQLYKAVQFLEIDDEGRGKLPVMRCKKLEDDSYNVEAPELLAALNAV